MFINIRGTFGSGKTTVVRQLMQVLKDQGAQENIDYVKIDRLDGKEKHFAHIYTSKYLHKPVIFIGKYGENACGGADAMSWKGAHEDIENYIMKHRKNNHIVIEGSITSGGSRYNRVGQNFMNEGLGAIYLHMATDRELCIERVIGRRKQRYEERLKKAREKGKPDPELKPFKRKNLDILFDTVQKQWDKTVALGLPAKYITSDPGAGEYIFNLMVRNES